MSSGFAILTGNTTDQENEKKTKWLPRLNKNKPVLRAFLLHQWFRPAVCLIHKNPAFRIKRALLSGCFFGEKNIHFGSLTSHLLNGKLGKRIGETIFSLHTKEGRKVNTTLIG